MKAAESSSSSAEGAESTDLHLMPRPALLRAYELAVGLPTLIWVGAAMVAAPHTFLDRAPMLLFWILSIAIIDLLPVPASGDLHFSLSFPLQLAVALLYPAAVATAVTVVGSSDVRELRGEMPVLKSLFIRTQIALSVGAESVVFHSFAGLHSRWYLISAGLLCATVVGYSMNVLFVAIYARLASGALIETTLRNMHVGIFGEFLLSYMGLAVFGVIIATSFTREGLWAVAVFIAPLVFARRMFFRTRSLEIATDELKQRQAENQYQALHDALTGLPNRVLFHQRLEEALTAAGGRSPVAVMIMDLDHFKEINDTLGHHHGDLLLREIGPRLGGALREGDTIARLGGDEFGMLLPEIRGTQTAVDVARRVLRALEHPFVLEGLALDVSGSIGIACSPNHGEDVETLVQRADVAMYSAKESRAGYEMYVPDRDRYSPQRLELLGQLRAAIDDQLELHFQPKADLPGGEIRGVEALVRWRHPDRGVLQPEEFLPFAERTALLTPLTLRVLDEALRHCLAWRRAGFDLQVAVNLSPRNLIDLHLPDEIAGLLVRWNVPSSALLLEMTENTLLTDPNRAIDVLARLNAIGVGLSIDDYGTGHSSLSYLKRLPVKELKIDKSFILSMASDPNDAIIVRSTIELAHNLGMRVVGEGVESEQAWNQLAALGCDVVQGFHLSPPLPPQELTRWLTRRLAMPQDDDELIVLGTNGQNGQGTATPERMSSRRVSRHHPSVPR